jgi:hypothetical protein
MVSWIKFNETKLKRQGVPSNPILAEPGLDKIIKSGRPIFFRPKAIERCGGQCSAWDHQQCPMDPEVGFVKGLVLSVSI